MKSECARRRGRPVVGWKDKVKEYMHERVADRGGGIELARREGVEGTRRQIQDIIEQKS